MEEFKKQAKTLAHGIRLRPEKGYIVLALHWVGTDKRLRINLPGPLRAHKPGDWEKAHQVFDAIESASSAGMLESRAQVDLVINTIISPPKKSSPGLIAGTLGALAKEYWVLKKHLNSKHLQSERARLEQFPFLDIHPDEISVLAAQSWVEEKIRTPKEDGGWKIVTANKFLATLRAILRMGLQTKPRAAHSNKELAAIPNLKVLKERKIKSKDQAFLTAVEINAVLGNIEDEGIRLAFEFAFWTGLRPCEYRRLRFDDWNEEDGTLEFLRGRGGNSGEWVHVLSPRATAILKKRRMTLGADSLVFPEVACESTWHNISRTHWNPAIKASGVTKALPPKNLRHSYATHWAKTLNPFQLRDQMGHCSLDMLQERYYKTNVEDLRDLMEGAA